MVYELVEEIKVSMKLNDLPLNSSGLSVISKALGIRIVPYKSSDVNLAFFGKAGDFKSYIYIHETPLEGDIKIDIGVNTDYSILEQDEEVLKMIYCAIVELNLLKEEFINNKTRLFLNFSPSTILESERFAGEFLLPKKDFLPVWGENLGDYDLISKATGFPVGYIYQRASQLCLLISKVA